MRVINHDSSVAGKEDGVAVLPVRTILHVDLDAFYAAVEMRDQPALANRPVIVGADPKQGRGRGVVAAANYAARTFGIRSAMPISQAYRRCPDAVYLRPRMSHYVGESARFREILGRYTDLVEPISIDEAFLDVTASRALYGDGAAIAARIRAAIRSEQGLTASVGVAPTKFVAKIASDLEKPDALVVVEPDAVQQFLAGLPIERLWGAGPKAVGGFRRMGARTIGDVAAMSATRLAANFGEILGHHFHDLARGLDPRSVSPDHERKSVGRESTFSADVADRVVVERRLYELIEEVTYRLRCAGIAGRIVTLKFRTADFTTITRRTTVAVPVDTTEAVWPVARELLEKADQGDQAVRLIGISLASFSDAHQLALFDTPVREKGRRLARAIDSVTARFGERAIRRGIPGR